MKRASPNSLSQGKVVLVTAYAADALGLPQASKLLKTDIALFVNVIKLLRKSGFI
ncbi:hypothetical protein [Nostoc linckia]|uniref:hypothetical protein n=1 Tax=Nostoc linckia TaxID=92942 RepID=UPI0015D4AA5E|nr:hypothetical protein [Nostoc linckia]